MLNYTYKIINKNGKEGKGSIDAENREKAMKALKSEGYTVLSLEESNIFTRQITFRQRKVKPRDLSVFCRQFYSLLKAGVNIIVAIDMLAAQTENLKLKKATLNVRDSIEKGETLAGALRREGNIFPTIMVSMMEAGESSGNIELTLERMAVHFEKDTKVKGMLKKAMLYPIILMIVAVIVILVMVIGVLPSFAKMFTDMGEDLPTLTQSLINLSDVIRNYWYVFILAIAGIIIGYKTYAKSEKGSRRIARIKLKIPVYGRLQIKTASARFARTFSTMLASGMPMVEAMHITARTMDSIVYEDVLHNAAMQIERGQPLSQPLKMSGLFPPLIIHMVGIGEESGNLEEMLDNCAGYYDEEVEMATQQLMALMEPMIIVVMAVIVCILLAAIYGPVISMYNALGNS